MSNRHYRWPRYQPVEVETMDDISDTSNQTWFQGSSGEMQLHRTEMNELIMDYLVHEGFKEAAERFREEAGMELGGSDMTTLSTNGTNQNQSNSGNGNNIPINNDTRSNSNNTDQQNATNNGASPMDEQQQVSAGTRSNGSLSSQPGTAIEQLHWSRLSRLESPEMMDKRIEVRHLIEEGDILKAQSLINLYYPEFLDLHRTLYFKLQQQHLIELIRRQRISDVLAYVHDYLSVDELRDLGEMERTLALLAYEHPDKSPYANLLHNSHRLQLASEINDNILQETTGDVEPSKPRLVTMLKMLFWTQNQLEKKKIEFPKMTLSDFIMKKV